MLSSENRVPSTFDATSNSILNNRLWVDLSDLISSEINKKKKMNLKFIKSHCQFVTQPIYKEKCMYGQVV